MGLESSVERKDFANDNSVIFLEFTLQLVATGLGDVWHLGGRSEVEGDEHMARLSLILSDCAKESSAGVG